MQIEIAIRHEFGDLSAFANFAAKLKDLFAEFAPVTVREPTPAPRFDRATADYLSGKSDKMPTIEPTGGSLCHPVIPSDAELAAVEKNSDIVAAPVSPDSAASVLSSADAERRPSAPMSEASVPRTPKARGPYKKKSESVEVPAAVSLPVAGTFGGPAVASPPATAPAAADVPPASVAAPNNDDGLNEHRAFCLEWVGRNRAGHPRYMKVLAKYQDKAAGKVRLQDFDRATREAIVAELKKVEATDAD